MFDTLTIGKNFPLLEADLKTRFLLTLTLETDHGYYFFSIAAVCLKYVVVHSKESGYGFGFGMTGRSVDN